MGGPLDFSRKPDKAYTSAKFSGPSGPNVADRGASVGCHLLPLDSPRPQPRGNDDAWSACSQYSRGAGNPGNGGRASRREPHSAKPDCDPSRRIRLCGQPEPPISNSKP